MGGSGTRWNALPVLLPSEIPFDFLDVFIFFWFVRQRFCGVVYVSFCLFLLPYFPIFIPHLFLPDFGLHFSTFSFLTFLYGATEKYLPPDTKIIVTFSARIVSKKSIPLLHTWVGG
jgi:hypothetical protein